MDVHKVHPRSEGVPSTTGRLPESRLFTSRSLQQPHPHTFPRGHLLCRSLDVREQSATSSESIKGVVVTEADGRRRRKYLLRGTKQAVVEDEVLTREEQASNFVDGIKGFFLPKGYPDTVTPDYLRFQLWAVPAHVTGWMSTSLATSSLLKAVGVGNSAVGATSAAAAIKWITKDGIGAAGRVLVGGRLGNVFDEDPKRWRMVAEAFLTVGLALEIATAFSPGNFIVLAGAGNLSRAVGRGMTNPCFRIIQTHFAAASNIGDVAAKEEVWEVSAQLMGLAASVGLLRAIEATGKPENVLGVWAAVQVLHSLLRYKSLAVLQFPSLNQKRACLLAAAHVAGQPLPGVPEGNAQENLLAWPTLVRPSLWFGCTLQEAMGSRPNCAELQELLRIYEGEKHMLIWRGGKGQVLLHQEAQPRDALRPVWQAAWLEQQGVEDAGPADLSASLDALRKQGPAFEKDLSRAGWNTDQITILTGTARYL
ncbi:g4720 [Coccomyxa elongata]